LYCCKNKNINRGGEKAVTKTMIKSSWESSNNTVESNSSVSRTSCFHSQELHAPPPPPHTHTPE
jgi:hypothetical protein